MGIFNIGVFLLIGIVLGYVLKSHISKTPQQPKAPAPQTSKPSSKSTVRLYDLAEQLWGFFEQAAHPKDLLENNIFQQGTQMLSASEYSDEQLIEYYVGNNVAISCMALEALSKRSLTKAHIDQVISAIASRYGWTLFFAFRLLEKANIKPIVGATLLQAPEWWQNDQLIHQMLKDFIDQRLENDERATFGTLLKDLDTQRLNIISDLIKILNHPGLEPLKEEIRQASETQVDREYLKAVGRLWDPMEARSSFSRRWSIKSFRI